MAAVSTCKLWIFYKSELLTLIMLNEARPVKRTSQSIRLYTNFMTLVPHFTFTELQGVFHGAFITGVAYQQGVLTLPDTWFSPFSGLAYALHFSNLL